MDGIAQLRAQIVSATKTLNSRIRRLRAEDLPSFATPHMQDIELHRPGFLTKAGYVSSSSAGLDEFQLREKLRLIKGLISETETVTQAREIVEKKMKEWNVKKQEAIKRIKAGRVFYQVLGYRGGVFDSDRVHVSIEEFEHTPSYSELIDRIYRDYGHELQNEVNGRIILLEWMNEKHEIPVGVEAVEDPQTGRIVYGYIDHAGRLIEKPV